MHLKKRRTLSSPTARARSVSSPSPQNILSSSTATGESVHVPRRASNEGCVPSHPPALAAPRRRATPGPRVGRARNPITSFSANSLSSCLPLRSEAEGSDCAHCPSTFPSCADSEQRALRFTLPSPSLPSADVVALPNETLHDRVSIRRIRVHRSVGAAGQSRDKAQSATGCRANRDTHTASDQAG